MNMNPIRYLQRNPFMRKVLALVGSAGLGQILGFLLSPIIARLYTPDNFGIYAVSTSCLSLAWVFTSLKFDAAIVGAESEQEARALTSLSIKVANAVSPILIMLLALVTLWPLQIFGALPVWWLGFTGVFIWLGGVYLPLWNYATRLQLFSQLAGNSILQTVTILVTRLLLGLMGRASIGLFVADLLSRSLSILWLLRLGLLRLVHSEPLNLRMVALKYQSYPRLMVASSLLDTFSYVALVPLIVIHYGLALGGQVAFAQRIIFLPINLLTQYIAEVFHSEFAALWRVSKPAAYEFFRRLTWILWALAATIAAVFSYVMPVVFPFVFGQIWQDVGLMVVFLSFWLLGIIAVNPLSRVLLVIPNTLVWKLWFDIYVTSTLLLVTVLVVSWELPAYDALILYSLLQLVGYGLYFAIIQMLLVHSVKRNA